MGKRTRNESPQKSRTVIGQHYMHILNIQRPLESLNILQMR